MRLTAKEARVLNEFVHQLYARFPRAIDRVVLFGSKARGDAGRQSDIDVLIIIAHANRDVEDQIISLVTEVLLRQAVDISPLVLSRQDFERNRRLRSPFTQLVLHEGIPLAKAA